MGIEQRLSLQQSCLSEMAAAPGSDIQQAQVGFE